MLDSMLRLLYDDVTSRVSPILMIQSMLLASLLALVIYFTYYITFSGVVYSKKFNVTLVMIAIISSMIVNISANSLAVSLGALGALSIVRFRTAVKDPRDTAYTFWAVAVGLGSSSGNYHIVILGTLFIALLLIILNFGLKADDKYLVIVRGQLYAMDSVRSALFNAYRAGKIRAETVTNTYAEIVYQVKLRKNTDITLYENIRSIEGVDYVNMVAQNGETLG